MAPDSVYASIIIPTHDRAETLPIAVRSALTQTRDDIEVIILGDGCTEACRSAALTCARDDARIRFLDRPKAPLRGAANRDLAVRSARSDRIFYSDDDDILLPHHVATLGPALDDFDVVDTPIASVAPNGRIHLGVHDSSNPLQRNLVASGQLKTVFDTHLAHRKQAYERLGEPWIGRLQNHHIVEGFLGMFAAHRDIQWCTLPRITALSFHGTRRLTMEKEARRQELSIWFERMSMGACEGHLRAIGTYNFHAFNLMRYLINAGIERASAHDFLECIAIGIDKRTHGDVYEDVLSILKLVYAEKIESRAVVPILNDLLEARYIPEFPIRNTVFRLDKILSFEEMSYFIEDLRGGPAKRLFELLVEIRLLRDIGELDGLIANELETYAPEDRYGFCAEAAGILSSYSKHLDRAWVWTGRAARWAPHSRYAIPLWTTRERLAERLGFEDERIAASRMVAELQKMLA